MCRMEKAQDIALTGDSEIDLARYLCEKGEDVDLDALLRGPGKAGLKVTVEELQK